jgi:hypothetical protein
VVPTSAQKKTTHESTETPKKILAELGVFEVSWVLPGDPDQPSRYN